MSKQQNIDIPHEYHIFVDDDIKLEYSKDFLSAFPDTDPKTTPPLRVFEEFLVANQAAVVTPTYINTGNQNHPEIIKQVYKNKCDPEGQDIPWIAHFPLSDDCMIAYHKCAIPYIFPMETKWESINWWISAILRQYKQLVLFRDSTVVDMRLTVINPEHRAYPQGNIPPGIVRDSTDYFNGSFLGKNHLIPADKQEFSFDARQKYLVDENDIICGKDIKWGPILKQDHC